MIDCGEFERRKPDVEEVAAELLNDIKAALVKDAKTGRTPLGCAVAKAMGKAEKRLR